MKKSYKPQTVRAGLLLATVCFLLGFVITLVILGLPKVNAAIDDYAEQKYEAGLRELDGFTYEQYLPYAINHLPASAELNGGATLEFLLEPGLTLEVTSHASYVIVDTSSGHPYAINGIQSMSTGSPDGLSIYPSLHPFILDAFESRTFIVTSDERVHFSIRPHMSARVEVYESNP